MAKKTKKKKKKKARKARFIGPVRQCCPKGATLGTTPTGHSVCFSAKGKRVAKLKKCPGNRVSKPRCCPKGAYLGTQGGKYVHAVCISSKTGNKVKSLKKCPSSGPTKAQREASESARFNGLGCGCGG